MTEENEKEAGTEISEIRGALVRRLNPAPIRIVAIITGFSLIRGLLSLVGRYLLAVRKQGTAKVEGSFLTLNEEWSVIGKTIRSVSTSIPIATIDAVRFENRKRYVHLLIGFGCLAIGVWLGIQWLVEGLRAGFPLLATLGAGIVAAGVAIDLILYVFVPEGAGSSRVIFALGPWKLRLAGVKREDAESFMGVISKSLKSGS